MFKRITLIFISLFYISISQAQSPLDAYKYVIIPKTYSFLKIEDKYKLNSLTKFLFDKQGFKTVYKGENYPADLMENPCIGLMADVMNESNMFTSKLKVVLKDCRDNIVYTSKVGKSKEKEYQKSYYQALRNAFTSIEALGYKYNPDVAVPAPKPVPAPETVVSASPVPKKPVVNKAEPVAIKTAEPVAAAAPEKPVAPDKSKAMASLYKNDKFSFMLINQNNTLVAYVNESSSENYKKGELIATLIKTSIPNVYRVNWKNESGEYVDTTGYFDDQGNLKIDINRNGKIEVAVFTKE